MLGDVLRAQALVFLILVAGVVLAAATARWPGPGRALVRWADPHLVTIMIAAFVLAVAWIVVGPR